MAWVVAASSSLLLIALLQGVLLGRGKLGWYGLSDTLPSIVLAALLASVILLGRPLEALALPLYAVSFALAAFIVLPAALSNIGIIEIDWSFLGRLVASGAPFAFSMFFIFLCGRTSLFALERLADHSAVGRFFAAQRFTEISLEVATAASLVLFSKGVRSAGGKEAVQQGVAQASVLFWIFAAISVPMVVFTPLVLPMLLGREYEAATPIAQVLSLGLAFAATTRTLNGVVSAAGRAWYAGGVAMGGVLLNVLISFLIIPRMGAVGAAIAMVIAQVAMCVAYGVVLRNAFEIKMLNFIIPKFRV
jgi:O-antigen/teichoic acid export membrane protein